MTDQCIQFDWERIQDIARCRFNSSLIKHIEGNARWYWSRKADDYVNDASKKDFVKALKALEVLNKTEFSRFQFEAISDELETVRWFLDVMAQAPSEQPAKYFLYCRIWNCIGKAGIKLSQGKGIPDHRLSHAQKVFREICAQAGLKFPSDQALADALKRALRAMSATGAI